MLSRIPNRLCNVLPLSACVAPNPRRHAHEAAVTEALHCDGHDGKGDDALPKAAFSRLLRDSQTLPDGKRLHAHITMSGLESDPLLGSLLIHMYCKCDAIQEARLFFCGCIHEQNIYAWNFLIGAYSRLGQSDQVLQLYGLMQLKGIPPDDATFVQVLSSLDGPEGLHHGRQVHARILGSFSESNIVVCTALVSMYSKCGNLQNSREVFVQVAGKNVISCNAMISACRKHKVGHEAFQVFQQMQHEGTVPDKATYINMLCVCALHTSLFEGRHMHMYIIHSGVEVDDKVHTALVNMYGKCKCVHDARTTFKEPLYQDVITWNALLSAFSNNGGAMEALEFFHHMQECGISPNRVTFISLFDVLLNARDLNIGKQLHARIVCSSLDRDVVLGTAIVSMYGRCGCPEDAQDVFERIRERNVVTWSVMIAVLARHGHGKKALDCFLEMLQEGIIPDKFTYISVLDACASEVALAEGQHLHSNITCNQLDSDVVLANSLLSMYGKCGNFIDAYNLFVRMPFKSVVSWNALITAHAEQEHMVEALQLFDQMRCEGMIPDKITFLSILSVCASQFTLTQGTRMHLLIANMVLVPEVAIVICLIDMYGKCKNLTYARVLFENLPEKNLIAWNVMFSAYAHHGDSQELLLLFETMCQKGVCPDKFIFATLVSACGSWTMLSEGMLFHFLIVDHAFESDSAVASALVNMYGKCGSLEDATLVISRMCREDSVAWNTMICMHAQWECFNDAYAFYNQMQVEGFIPDKITLVNILSACAGHSALISGKVVHVLVVFNCFDLDIVVATALVTMYGKCGSSQNALSVFNRMPKHSLFTWNALVSAYANQGHGKEVLLIVDQMQKEAIMPDEITFVSVLSACSHAGLIDEAWQVLAGVRRDHGITLASRLYDSFIDLLGRAGRVDEAENLVSQMPCQPNSISWTSLSGACTNKGDAHRGEQAIDHILEIDMNKPASYVMLSRIYNLTC